MSDQTSPLPGIPEDSTRAMEATPWRTDDERLPSRDNLARLYNELSPTGEIPAISADDDEPPPTRVVPKAFRMPAEGEAVDWISAVGECQPPQATYDVMAIYTLRHLLRMVQNPRGKDVFPDLIPRQAAVMLMAEPDKPGTPFRCPDCGITHYYFSSEPIKLDLVGREDSPCVDCMIGRYRPTVAAIEAATDD
jgi:hypothetical protein